MSEARTTVVAEILGFSDDGYIRMTLQRLSELYFAQRTSITDDDLRNELRDQDVPAYQAGFCDWISVGAATHVCIGWAWFTVGRDAAVLLAPGGISTNVMLTSQDGRDLGMAKTNELISAWLSSQPWQNDVRPGGSKVQDKPDANSEPLRRLH